MERFPIGTARKNFRKWTQQLCSHSRSAVTRNARSCFINSPEFLLFATNHVLSGGPRCPSAGGDSAICSASAVICQHIPGGVPPNRPPRDCPRRIETQSSKNGNMGSMVNTASMQPSISRLTLTLKKRGVSEWNFYHGAGESAGCFGGSGSSGCALHQSLRTSRVFVWR